MYFEEIIILITIVTFCITQVGASLGSLVRPRSILHVSGAQGGKAASVEQLIGGGGGGGQGKLNFRKKRKILGSIWPGQRHCFEMLGGKTEQYH